MGISFFCHAAIFALLILISGYPGCEKEAFSAGAIQVDLVSLPADTDSGKTMSSAEIPPSSADKVSKKAPAFEKPKRLSRPVVRVSEKKQTETVKRSLKKKTFDPGQIVSKSLDRIQQKVDQEKSADESLSQALSRLRSEVEKKQQGGGKAGSGSPGGDKSRRKLDPIEIYKLEIRYHILENWVYSRQLAGDEKGLRTVIGIDIDQDGSITDIWYDRRSENEYFDESARRAVLKSDPLPALPQGYSSYTVGLEFTPSDLINDSGS